jgi:hypothetical protein
MPNEQDATQPGQSSDRSQLMGLVSANWAVLEEQLIAMLGHLTQVALPTARAIMFSVNCTAERLTILRNVALAQLYSDWHLIQMARVLSRVEEVDRARRSIFEAPMLPTTTPSNTNNTVVLSWVSDGDLRALVGRIGVVGADIREVVRILPKGRAHEVEHSQSSPGITGGGFS